jgi:hypothetical protein
MEATVTKDEAIIAECLEISRSIARDRDLHFQLLADRARKRREKEAESRAKN